MCHNFDLNYCITRYPKHTTKDSMRKLLPFNRKNPGDKFQRFVKAMEESPCSQIILTETSCNITDTYKAEIDKMHGIGLMIRDLQDVRLFMSWVYYPSTSKNTL